MLNKFCLNLLSLALLPFALLAEDYEPIVLTDATLQEYVYNSELPVVVDCYADWCGPCRTMEPNFKEAGEALQEEVVFCKYNIDGNSTLKDKHRVRGVPTLLFFKKEQADDAEPTLLKKRSGALKTESIIEITREVFKLDGASEPDCC